MISDISSGFQMAKIGGLEKKHFSMSILKV